MDNLEQNIRQLVESVLKDLSSTNNENAKVAQPEKTSVSSDMTIPLGHGIFADVESAVGAAKISSQELKKLPLKKREQIIAAMRKAGLDNTERLSRKAAEETGMGCWRDKLLKHELVSVKTPGVEDLTSAAYTDDDGLTLTELAPWGVIGAIIPSTNPSSTVICNAIGMVAAGNSVVFGPHPSAKEVSNMAVSLLNDAIVSAGGPRNVLTGLASPTIEMAGKLMHHKGIRLLVVTGGPAVVEAAMKTNKKVIAAGPGNPPCVVDETADIAKAGKDIVEGGGFDRNLICISEKEVIAVSSITDELKREMVKNGAYELDQVQIEAVTSLVVGKPGALGVEGFANKAFVGKSAQYIASQIGLDVPKTTKLLLCEVPKEHTLIWTEQLMPVMPICRVNNVDEGIDLAVACEHGFKHTAIMHSKNIESLSKMAKAMDCSIFIKNAPSYAGLGAGGAGFASFTIASPTGEGLTRARDFSRKRRCTLVDYFRIV
jgi:propionaldehyde dehydrogenase